MGWRGAALEPHHGPHRRALTTLPGARLAPARRPPRSARMASGRTHAEPMVQVFALLVQAAASPRGGGHRGPAMGRATLEGRCASAQPGAVRRRRARPTRGQGVTRVSCRAGSCDGGGGGGGGGGVWWAGGRPRPGGGREVAHCAGWRVGAGHGGRLSDCCEQVQAGEDGGLSRTAASRGRGGWRQGRVRDCRVGGVCRPFVVTNRPATMVYGLCQRGERAQAHHLSALALDDLGARQDRLTGALADLAIFAAMLALGTLSRPRWKARSAMTPRDAHERGQHCSITRNMR